MPETVWIGMMIIGGLVLLVAGGDFLVRGASRLAASLRISPLVIGLTIVAFGTERSGTGRVGAIELDR